MLGRLRVRGKLAVLVAAPLVMVVVLAAYVSADRFSRASAAARTVESVEVATEVGGVVADLQQERLISVGYLLGVADQADMALASAQVADEVADVTAELGDDMPARVRDALRNVSTLDSLRDELGRGQVRPDDVIARFGDVITPLLSSLRLADGVDGATLAGREVIALDALLRVDELNNRAAAQLVVAAGTKAQPSVIAYAADRAAVAGILSQFTTYATAAQVALYGLVGKAFTDRIGPTFDQSFATDPTGTIAQESASVIYPELTSFVVLGRFVETKIAADVTSAVTRDRNNDLIAAYGTAGLALLLVLLIALLSIAVARAVANPLTQLTHNADRVARIAEAELERVADDESDAPEPIRLEAVSVAAQDEVGDLARAFERVQSTAARLVERQAQSRRNVAEMLGHIGRRTQNLVGRQISIIDGLESDETDSSRLSELYRLDHVASRLRRNAGSLVVLSGASDAGGHFAPMPVVDVARLALAEIEAYTRVDLSIPDDRYVPPAIINDLVLVLAELMENATVFSPPHTRVSVTAVDTNIRIVDHGIGLSEARLAEENRRIAQRERLDLAPSEVLGLFVVGRLARRHGFSVVLSSTPGGGVTVHLDLAGHLVSAPTEQLRIGLGSIGTASAPRSERLEIEPMLSGSGQPASHRAAEPQWSGPAEPQWSGPAEPRWPAAGEPLPTRIPAPPPPAWPSSMTAPASADAPVTAGTPPLPRRIPAAETASPVWDFTPPADVHKTNGQRPEGPSAGWFRSPGHSATPPGSGDEVGDQAVRAAEAAAAAIAEIEAATRAAEIEAATYGTEQAGRAGIEDAELVDDDDRDSASGSQLPYNAQSLDRAMLMIEAVKPWRAFELPQPALPAVPFPAPGEPIERLAPSPAPADAAIEPETGAYASNPAERPKWPGPPAQPTVTGRAAVPSALAPRPDPVATPSAPAAPAQPEPPAGPGTHPVVVGSGLPLARRVPGATTVDQPARMSAPRATPALDAGEARQLVEAFELGVARALRDVEDETVQVPGWGGTGESQ